MTTRAEAERLLSALGDDDLVEISSNGEVYAVGRSPAAISGGKPIPGISDQKGEYHSLAE